MSPERPPERPSGTGADPRVPTALRLASSVVGAAAIRRSRACTCVNARVSGTTSRTWSACASRVMYSYRSPGLG
jgi:hypothetical protein